MSSLIVKPGGEPKVEPISLAEAKAHLRVDISDDDALIQGLIRAARANLERVYDIALMTQTLVLGRDYFPAVFGMGWGMPGWWLGNTWMAQYDTQQLRYGYIPLRGPVQSVTSVTYLDPTGASQVWASSNYLLDADSRPPRLTLALGKTFPPTAPLFGAVKVEFIAGYTDPALVPDDIKAAMKLYLGHLYENREEVMVGTRLVALQLPLGVQALMTTFEPNLVR
jgi:uncharacterized phiE125 gp8 family phage protein